MNKPILYVKQNKYNTVFRLKGSIGFCMVRNTDIESIGAAASIRKQVELAEQMNCNHAAKIYADMAKALA